MWDCWESGVTPRFAAWNGKKWVRWSVGAVSKDAKKCKGDTNKVVYSYVSLKGKKVEGLAYRLVKVKEYCDDCVTSTWTLPVLPTGAAAG